MAKRFTDTNKWRKGFIRSLPPEYKLLWIYILDECDHAGIWHVEIDVACARLGIEISGPDAVEKFGDHIVPFDNDEKWFIPDFIEFQYGELKPENRAHKSVIDLLNKYSLPVNIIVNKKGLVRGLQGAKDKDKDKDKDMVKDIKEEEVLIKEKKERKSLFRNSGVTIENIASAFEKTDDIKQADPKYYFNAMMDWSDSGGRLGIDWIASARKWARKDLAEGKLKVMKNPAPVRKSSNFDRIMETDYKRIGSTKPISEILNK
jgi:hypothetical protein